MSETQPLQTFPISERSSRVHLDQLASVPAPLTGFLESLPRLLAADALREVVEGIARARRTDRPVMVSMGAHIIKCGLAPVLIDLARRGLVTSFSTNGASVIHDVELALFGHTSEDVARGLEDGTFGMAEETHVFVNEAVRRGASRGIGFGESVGTALLESGAPHLESSLLAEATRLRLPFTVHVAIGTDIVHMHSTADGAAIGAASLRDFHRLADLVADLRQGVLLNLGSAVIMPEVVLKAIAMARNRGVSLEGCLSVDLDMIRGYRTQTQLVDRIRHLGGRGQALTGHHEIMLPLLAALLLAESEREGGPGGRPE